MSETPDTIRLHHLAQEWGVSHTLLAATLQKAGFDVPSSFAELDRAELPRYEKAWADRNAEPEPEPEPEATPEPEAEATPEVAPAPEPEPEATPEPEAEATPEPKQDEAPTDAPAAEGEGEGETPQKKKRTRRRRRKKKTEAEAKTEPEAESSPYRSTMRRERLVEEEPAAAEASLAVEEGASSAVPSFGARKSETTKAMPRPKPSPTPEPNKPKRVAQVRDDGGPPSDAAIPAFARSATPTATPAEPATPATPAPAPKPAPAATPRPAAPAPAPKPFDPSASSEELVLAESSQLLFGIVLVGILAVATIVVAVVALIGG